MDGMLTLKELLAASGLAPGTPNNVYVDFAAFIYGNGTQPAPLKTLAEGLAMVAENGTIHLESGATPDTCLINQPVTLTTQGGLVQIGLPE